MSEQLETLRCIKDSLEQIQRMLEYEHGLPAREIRGHNPRTLPIINRLDVPASGERDLDLTADGGTITRGHISNIGNFPALLFFETLEKKAEKRTSAGPYQLEPGTTLEFSHFVEKIRVQATAAGDVSVQTLHQ